MTHSPINKDVDPNLPVFEGVPDISPFELIGLGNTRLALALILESEDDESSLLLSQKACRLGEVIKSPEGEDSDQNSDNTLKNEDPAPHFESTDTVHLSNGECKKTAEGTGDGSGGKEKGLSELDLMSAVPHCKVILSILLLVSVLKANALWTYRDTREQTSLGNAQKDSSDEKTSIILNDSHQGHHEAPCYHDRRKPDAWTELFEEQVGGDFEGGVCEEEDGETPVVLVRTHFEIFLKAFDLCISDISS